jgi:DNA-binding SARP family transcriptional activator
MWRIQLLGYFRACTADRVVASFSTRQTGLLLAYLALRPAQVTSRDRMVELLWPDADLAAGRHRLNQALYALRALMEASEEGHGPIFVSDRSSVGCRAISTDVSDFRALVAQAQAAREGTERQASLRRALELYAGELLPGYREEWVVAERQRLAEGCLWCLDTLAEELAKSGAVEEALELAQRAVGIDPLHEGRQIRLMRLYSAAGDLGSARRQFEQFERALLPLGLRPSAAAREFLPTASTARRNEASDFADGLDWFLSRGDYASASRLAVTMTSYWIEQGPLLSGVEAVQKLIARLPALGAARDVGRAYLALGSLQHQLGDDQNAAKAFIQAARIGENMGDLRRLAGAWNGHGHLLVRRGEHSRALSLLKKSHRIASQTGELQREGVVRFHLGRLASELGRWDAALCETQASLLLADRTEDLVLRFYVSRQLFLLALREGDQKTADKWLDEMGKCGVTGRSHLLDGIHASAKAQMWLRAGKPDAALPYMRTALGHCQEVGDRYMLMAFAGDLAGLLAARGDGPSAAEALAMSERARSFVGCVVPALHQLGFRVASDEVARLPEEQRRAIQAGVAAIPLAEVPARLLALAA